MRLNFEYICPICWPFPVHVQDGHSKYRPSIPINYTAIMEQFTPHYRRSWRSYHSPFAKRSYVKMIKKVFSVRLYLNYIDLWRLLQPIYSVSDSISIIYLSLLTVYVPCVVTRYTQSLRWIHHTLVGSSNYLGRSLVTFSQSVCWNLVEIVVFLNNIYITKWTKHKSLLDIHKITACLYNLYLHYTYTGIRYAIEILTLLYGKDTVKH